MPLALVATQVLYPWKSGFAAALEKFRWLRSGEPGRASPCAILLDSVTGVGQPARKSYLGSVH